MRDNTKQLATTSMTIRCTFEAMQIKCHSGIEVRSRRAGMTSAQSLGAQFLAFQRAKEKFDEKKGGFEKRFLFFLEKELDGDCVNHFNEELNEEINAMAYKTEIENFRANELGSEVEKVFELLNGNNGITELARHIKKSKRSAYRFLQHTVQHFAAQPDLFLTY